MPARWNRLAAAVLPALAVLACPAWANTIFTTTLLGSNENPANGSTALGYAIVNLASDDSSVSVQVIFTGLTVAATASHIHCCVLPGTNGPVVVPFSGFPNATSGTYSNTFALPSSLTGGITLQTFLTGLESGQAYVNIHDATFPGGEIRGFLAAEAVPEPATIWLMGLGLTAGALGLKRKLSRT
jgi:hypothetical protein